MKCKTAFAISMLALAVVPAASHSRLEAALACTATQDYLHYECTVRIADTASNEAVEGLTVEVKADMPSMPMAHNIPPVTAQPTGEPGVYAFPINLDMFGNWAFSMQLSGTREDMIVEVLGLRAGEAQAGQALTEKSGDRSDEPGSDREGHHKSH
ncbi:FixH family protein [Mesorhizobium sp. CN2-181]|uniref:FixH family protein n=1 Tax=Mesorhizobium yinganensis TaxID=3157707 RepID=UPI0032B7DE21